MKSESFLEFAGLKRGLATVVAGLCLLLPASMGIFTSEVPRVLGPFPAITAIPALFFSSRALAVAVPSLIFFAWNPGLLRGESVIPKRSPWLFGVATVLSVIWFVMGWKYGLQYQGARYVYEICVANVAWIALLAAAFSMCRKGESSFRLNLALHWLMFAWLAWCAFPYLGELP